MSSSLRPSASAVASENASSEIRRRPEEVCAAGCVGEKLISACAQAGINIKSSKLLNLGGGIVPHGSAEELMHDCGIDDAAIVEAAVEMIGADEKSST